MILGNVFNWAWENPAEVLGGTIITFLSGLGAQGILKNTVSIGSGSSKLIIGGLTVLVGGIITKYCLEHHANRDSLQALSELRAELARKDKEQEQQAQINANRLAALRQNAVTLKEQQELILKLQETDEKVHDDSAQEDSVVNRHTLFARKPVKLRNGIATNIPVAPTHDGFQPS